MTALEKLMKNQWAKWRALENIFSLELVFPQFILFCFSIFLSQWYRFLLSPLYVSGWDLSGQITTVERIMAQLPHGRFSFYDPSLFCGWGVDLFYAPLSHIVAAILGCALAEISTEPARWACHLVLNIGCAALPFSFWYFILPLANCTTGKDRLSIVDGSILALSVCFFSFWFLNHDAQFWGIGQASVVGVGLFAQLFGWHFLLLYFGAVSRLIESSDLNYQRLVSVFFGLLFLSHSLTAVFALGITAMFCCWYQQYAWVLIRSCLLGAAMCCFWFVPALLLNNTYAVFSMIKPQGDFLEILLRYPLALLVKHIQSCLNGQYVPIDFGTLLADLFFFLYFLLTSIRRSQVAIALFLMNFIAIVFTNDLFVSRSFQITLHYYRFFAYELLLLICLLCLVPLALSRLVRAEVLHGICAGCIMLLLCSGIYSISCFPHYERLRTEQRFNRPSEDQVKVLNYFKELPIKGRIFLEHFDDEKKHGFLTAHYIESRLFKETGFETTNGLFIESSNAYRLIATSADALAAHSWATSLVFGMPDGNRPRLALEELRDHGVTQIVCTKDSELSKKLNSQNLKPTKIFGPYAIYQISNLPSWKIRQVDRAKLVVGFDDRARNLPFHFLEAYMQTRSKMYENVQLVDLTNRAIPNGVDVVLINTGRDDSAVKIPAFVDYSMMSHVKMMRLNFSKNITIDHYNVWYQDNAELDAYKDVADYLDSTNLPARLNSLKVSYDSSSKTRFSSPELLWSTDYQAVRLKNLTIGALYQLDYTYLPFWKSSQASIYRGSTEQIYLIPDAETVILVYDPWSQPYAWIGSAIALCGFYYLWKFDRTNEFLVELRKKIFKRIIFLSK